eukprot:757153-Hanusia_phi.AAC.12
MAPGSDFGVQFPAAIAAGVLFRDRGHGPSSSLNPFDDKLARTGRMLPALAVMALALGGAEKMGE